MNTMNILQMFHISYANFVYIINVLHIYVLNAMNKLQVL